MSESDVRAGSSPGSPSDPGAVDRLLAAAEAHPLGVEFLKNGFLGAVAATFGVHAFTVEEARRRLGSGAQKEGEGLGLP